MDLTSLKPVLGYRPGRSQGRLLMVCFYDPNGIPTVYENIANWQQFSRFRIDVVNLWPGRNGALLSLPESLDLAQYAGVIIHSTVSYFPHNLYALDQRLDRPFEEFDGLKILMKQDEQVQTNRFSEYIAKKKIDLVVTCVPPEEIGKVYPRDVVGDVDFLHAYTGYLSPSLRSMSRPSIAARSIDVSYRGSIQPLEFGRLGYEKRGIGYDVSAALKNAPDLKVDISSRWEDRINGTSWFDFLSQSKVVLGVESGSNLFDFTGEVAAWCREYEARNKGIEPTSEEFYLKAHDEYLHRFEGNVNYAQISPRHFEAAVCRAAQILYEGEYSGIFVPYRHFLPLKRDLSNIEEAIDFARDENRLKEFADRAYEEIIPNPAYHYEHFVEMFDNAVEQRMKRRGPLPKNNRPGRSDGPPAPKALLLMAHEPTIDPRIDWFSEGLAKDFEVCEIGIYPSSSETKASSYERLSDRRSRIRIDGGRIVWDFVTPAAPPSAATSVGIDTIKNLFYLEQLPSRPLGNAIGAIDADKDDLYRFRWYCQYFASRNSALLQAARQVGAFDLVVAVDLDTLPAAVALAEEYGVPVVYDAHEYWPYSNPAMRHWEIEFWMNLEKTLLAHTTLRLTVSPHLAEEMSRQYDCSFSYIPNCASLGVEQAIDLDQALEAHARREEVVFLFQGNFSPNRGIDKLIEAWDAVDPRARLWLRGPTSELKTEMIRMARNKGLLDRTVFFPDAVSEDELVGAAREADVGLIPYEPYNLNYRYSSPNKLSQYMAAGLPIICNEIDFVKAVVEGNGVGTAVNFGDKHALANVVNEYVRDRQLIQARSRKEAVFKEKFNWQNASQETYRDIRQLVSATQISGAEFNTDRIGKTDRWKHEPSPREDHILYLEDYVKKLSDEIQRLHKDYPDHINMLTREIERLSGITQDVRVRRILYHRTKSFVAPRVKGAVKAAIRYRVAWPLKALVEAVREHRRRRP
jgi:glycosyltransferase involved in cell wall biosynthesis